MATNEYVMAEPFYKQEILRNVAIGFTPYMPFTQKYRLDMDSDFAGRGTGYMADAVTTPSTEKNYLYVRGGYSGSNVNSIEGEGLVFFLQLHD